MGAISAKLSRLGISAKINLALAAVFILVLIASLGLVYNGEHDLVEETVLRQTHDTADGYFDTINALMLTGTMANRQVLQKKVLERPNIKEARIIRSPAVASVFGPGFDDEQPLDQLDRRALEGEEIEVMEGNLLTVINPVIASSDHRGTNCLTCHQVSEGTVLGAVRISYSMEQARERINSGIVAVGSVMALLFAGGLLLIIFLMRGVVTKRINGLHRIIDTVASNSDLSQRFDVRSNDEFGSMATAFNQMVEQFQHSLRRVFDTTLELKEVSGQIAASAETTAQAVAEQTNGTQMAVTSMQEIASSVSEVAEHAAQTAEASSSATDEAQGGAIVATKALAGIDALMSNVEEAAEVIQSLDSNSEKIGVVLDVIKNIAEQTNLLALNAAIEAARAGEHGRGFAVVADEVRTLATRTHESTKEIEEMIAGLQSRANEAVKVIDSARGLAKVEEDQVERAAEALGMIVGEVMGIKEMNAQIVEAVETQKQMAQGVNTNLENIELISESTLEEAQRNRQFSERLTEIFSRLEQVVGGFKLS